MFSLLTPHLPARKDFLRETYTSLLEQTASWEWIIEVDGQGDFPKEIAGDSRVHIRENDLSLSPSNYRNLAFARSQGNLIIALDDDDLLYPGCLEKLEKFMSSRPDLGAAIGQGFLLAEEGIGPWIRYGHDPADYYPFDEDIPPGKIFQIKEKIGSHLLPSGPTLYRREEIIRLGGWPALRGSGDSLLLYRANQERPIGHPHIPYFIYRLYGGNDSKDKKIKDLREQNMSVVRILLGRD